MSDEITGTRIQFAPPVPSPPMSSRSIEEQILYRLKKIESDIGAIYKRLNDHHEPVINAHEERLDLHSFKFEKMEGVLADVRDGMDKLTGEATARGMLMNRVDIGLIKILEYIKNK